MRILLIEDNPTDALLIRRELSRSENPPIELHHVASLGEGLQKLTRPRRFDAVLLDLSLPDEYGLDTVARTVRAAPQTPVIVLTGMRSQEVALEAIRTGAQDYVVKDELDGRLLRHALVCGIERFRQMIALNETHADPGTAVTPGRSTPPRQ